MNSKGWKLGLFAIAAVIGLSACGDKKKSKAGSPYAGIWINQRNLQEYSAHRARLNANDYRSFCPIVYKNPERYGDSELRVRALLVHSNGEVYRYMPGESLTALGFREANYIGNVNAAGSFTAGNIGPDGRVVSSWAYQGYGSGDMPAQTTFSFSPSNRNVIRVFNSSEVIFLERHNRTVADEYVVHVTTCLVELRKWRESHRNHPRKDCDPQIQRCDDDRDDQQFIVPQDPPGRRGRG